LEKITLPSSAIVSKRDGRSSTLSLYNVGFVARLRAVRVMKALIATPFFCGMVHS